MSISSAIKRLKNVRAKLTNPVHFFTKVKPAWHELAKTTALTILLQNRPPDVDDKDWQHTASYTAAQIATTLTGDLFETAGLSIYLGERKERSFTSVIMAAATNNLSLEEIADYVQAGIDGDPYGKPDIDERDTGKSPQQIAFTISRSIQNGNESRAEQIRIFLEERNSLDAQKLYEAILHAWFDIFSVRASEDWKAYVRQAIRG